MFPYILVNISRWMKVKCSKIPYKMSVFGGVLKLLNFERNKKRGWGSFFILTIYFFIAIVAN